MEINGISVFRDTFKFQMSEIMMILKINFIIVPIEITFKVSKYIVSYIQY
jgi:hypothetical protein